MRWILFSLLIACTCNESPPNENVEREAVATSERSETAEAPEQANPPRTARPVRPATPAERAARVAALPAPERERLAQRSAHVRRGRQLGRSGDHEGALAAFEDALVIAPTDPIVLCEAGFQAVLLERWDGARQRLERALRQPMQPRTRGACLYNLARANDGKGGNLGATAWLLEQSLRHRENRRVEEWLNEIDEELGELEERDEWEFQLATAGPDFDLIRAAGPHAELQELQRSARCFDADTETAPANGEVLEIRTLLCEDEEMRTLHEVVVARFANGWTLTNAIAESDTTDSYGRLEASESIREMRWDDGKLIVEVAGSYDEIEGEADAYWSCEEEFPDDEEKQSDCFETALEDLDEPERWSSTYTFRVEAERLIEENVSRE
ncbi:MAG: hypothetical protein AAGE52_41225 [Myxococcota bacterium]